MGLISAILDLYENLRPTTSKVEDNKKKDEKPRNYTFDGGFTGDKKQDYNNIRTPKPAENQTKKKVIEDREDR